MSGFMCRLKKRSPKEYERLDNEYSVIVFSKNGIVKTRIRTTESFMQQKNWLFLLILFFTVPNAVKAVELDKQAQVNAETFLQLVSKKQYSEAFKYTSGSISWRSKGMNRNRVIDSEEEFIKLAPIVFNQTFIDTVNKQENIKISCCLSSFYFWDDGENNISFWFEESGRPLTIVNESIIQPSFDCSEASTKNELAICSSLELSEQDNKLNAIYLKAHILLTDVQYIELKSRQIEFIIMRNKCDGLDSCVKNETEKRINELTSLIINVTMAEDRVSARGKVKPLTIEDVCRNTHKYTYLNGEDDRDPLTSYKKCMKSSSNIIDKGNLCSNFAKSTDSAVCEVTIGALEQAVIETQLEKYRFWVKDSEIGLNGYNRLIDLKLQMQEYSSAYCDITSEEVCEMQYSGNMCVLANSSCKTIFIRHFQELMTQQLWPSGR